MPKTLILTSTAPGSGGVGDIYINNIISGFDKSHFVRISLVKKQNVEFADIWSEIESKVILIEKSHYPFLSTLYFTRFLRKALLKITDELILFLKKENIEKIWVTLSSPEIIMLVREISLKSRVKIYSTIWDVPEYLLQNNHFDPITCKLVMNAFHSVLACSERISVIDEGMKNYLPSGMQLKSVIIRNGVTFPKTDSEQKKIKDGNVIRIAFAGSIYAKKEWNAFVRSLISCDFIINGKQVELICIGRLPRFGIVKDERIDFRPFMPNKDVLQILAGCDIGYVPYWFSHSKRLIVSTSFPGKVSSYVSSDLKVFFHGPLYATVNSFFDKTRVGICCNSLKKNDIIKCIADADCFKVYITDFTKAKNTLGLEYMKNQFQIFIQNIG